MDPNQDLKSAVYTTAFDRFSKLISGGSDLLLLMVPDKTLASALRDHTHSYLSGIRKTMGVKQKD